MSFGAARVAPEKAVLRPALPMSFKPALCGTDMTSKRKPITKKTRFEVFKRDGFKCQYCGTTAPEAVLVVDHINPVSKNGDHDMMNFITACQPCNSGKSDRKLDDSTALSKQRAQLDELANRREQLEMMLEWRNSMKDIESDSVKIASDAWEAAVTGWHLNDAGLKALRRHLKAHGVVSVLDAIEKAVDSYIRFDDDGKAIHETVETAWNKVGGILRLEALPEDRRKLYYVRGILRKRLNYVGYSVLTNMERALEYGVPVEDIERESKTCRNWTEFNRWLMNVGAEG